MKSEKYKTSPFKEMDRAFLYSGPFFFQKIVRNRQVGERFFIHNIH